MSQKYEREIDEIIRRQGDFLKGERVPPPPLKRRPRRLTGFSPLATRFSMNPGRLMMASIAMALVFWLLISSTIPWLGSILILGAVALFLFSYALSFMKPSGGYEKRWRGQMVQPPPGPVWIDHVSRLFRRLR